MDYSDYEKEVKKVYPKAKELDNEQEDLYASRWWIGDGNGNDISDDVSLFENAWQSAYERLNIKNTSPQPHPHDSVEGC